MESVQPVVSQRWPLDVNLATTKICLALVFLTLLLPVRGFVPDHPVDDGAHNWLLFPKTTVYGVFIAMAVPLETVNKDVSVAFNFDGSFDLPDNATELSILESEFGWRKRRSTRAVHRLRDVSREIVYEGFEKALGRLGMPERPCLLQAICEAAERPMGLEDHDLVSDIVHFVLTPSRSKDADLHDDYHRAERLGKEGKDCATEFSNCGHSVLSLISVN